MTSTMNAGSMFFMSLLGVFGIILIIVSARGFNKIKPSCDSEKLRGSLRAMIIMGSICLSLVFTYIICHTRCGCTSASSFPWLDATIYAGIAAISIATLVLSIQGKSGLNTSKGCGDSVLAHRLKLMMGISIAMIVILCIALYIFFRDLAKGKRGAYIEEQTRRLKKSAAAHQKRAAAAVERRRRQSELAAARKANKEAIDARIKAEREAEAADRYRKNVAKSAAQKGAASAKAREVAADKARRDAEKREKKKIGKFDFGFRKRRSRRRRR